MNHDSSNPMQTDVFPKSMQYCTRHHDTLVPNLATADPGQLLLYFQIQKRGKLVVYWTHRILACLKLTSRCMGRNKAFYAILVLLTLCVIIGLALFSRANSSFASREQRPNAEISEKFTNTDVPNPSSATREQRPNAEISEFTNTDAPNPSSATREQRPKAEISENCGNRFANPLKPVDPNYKKHVKYKFVTNDRCYPGSKSLYWNVDKKVVVRSVFPEGRNWNGHSSSYVFMIEADRLMLSKGSFTKCQVGDQNTTDVDYFVPENVLQNDGWCPLTHLQAVVHCYLPLNSSNNSRSFLHYRMGPDSPTVVAESERPLWIPPPRVKSTSAEKITIASCIATQYGQPPFLGEWVRYQKTIGVDHIHMVAEPSIRESGALNDPSVKKAMEEGFLSIDVWFKWFSAAQIYDHSQLLAYQDCLHRFQGTYDYLFPHDADDFFVPMESDHRQLPYYVSRYCEGAGTCQPNVPYLWGVGPSGRRWKHDGRAGVI